MRAAGTGRGRDGFALVEVMIALMLIALLAAVALPGLVRATGAGALRTTAMQASALLRDDRNAAMSSGNATMIVVDDGGRRLRSVGSRAAVGMPPGIAAALRVTSGAPGIRFFGDGRSSGGTILLAADSASVTIAISPDTGAIHVGAP